MIEYCHFCQEAGRTWRLLDGHVYCGLCGSAVRRVDVRGTADSGQGLREPGGLNWLVTADTKDAASIDLYVVNSGTLPVRVSGVTAPRARACKIEVEPQELQRRDAMPVTLRLTGPAQQYPRELELVVEGNFRKHTVSIPVVQAPRQFTAQAAEEDEWSRRAAGGDGTLALLPLFRSAGATVTWEAEEGRHLVLMPAAGGETVIEIVADPGSWFGGSLPPVSAAQWEGEGNVTVRVEDQKTEAADDQGNGSGESDGAPAIHVALTPGPLEGPVSGVVTFQFGAIGAPRVRIPVRLLPGRPEWKFEPAGEQLLLPCGCSSVLYFSCTPENAAPGLLRQVEDYRLEVTAADAAVTSDGWGGRVRVQRVKPALPSGLRFRVTVTPPLRPGEMILSLQLMAILDKRPAALSPLEPIKIQTLDPRNPLINEGCRLVIDFGTTYTCVGRSDALGNLEACLHLRDAAIPGPQPEMVPTALWVRAGGTEEEPDCLIGFDADRGPVDEVFRLFKPDISEKKARGAGPNNLGGPLEFLPKRLAYLFLRELLIEVRARLEHKAVQDVYVTCPATFTAEQRHDLEGVLGQLRGAGVTGKTALLMDEATAGAFRDLNGFLKKSKPPRVNAMIFDFGGGTIDIAALQAVRDAGQPENLGIYQVKPLGITGLRDFGGKHVTDAIARCMARRLVEYLYLSQPTQMKIMVPPWLPLPPERMPPNMSTAGQPPHVRKLAEENWQFIRAIAEQVKIKFYGAWPASFKNEDGTIQVPEGCPEWYGELSPQLDAAVLSTISADTITAEHSAARFRLVVKPEAGKPVGDREVSSDEWRKYFEGCRITRAELDELIAPALREAFGRGRRLWSRTSPASQGNGFSHPYVPPDLLILAGGSSLLPLVWKVASEPETADGQDRLAFPVHRILFSEKEAKRKVALGGALYARVRNQPVTEVAIRPEDTLKYLLIPLVYEVQGTRYERIFPLGYEVTEEGQRQTIVHHHPDPDLELLIYENVDYRDDAWQLPPALSNLGMHAPGKAPLALFFLSPFDSRRPEVFYRVFRKEGELTRKMGVEFHVIGAAALKSLEKPI